MRKFVICYVTLRFEDSQLKSVLHDVLADGFDTHNEAQNYLQNKFAPDTKEYLTEVYPSREVTVDYGRDGNVRIQMFDKEKVEGLPYYEETMQYIISAVDFGRTGDVNFTVDSIGNFIPLN